MAVRTGAFPGSRRLTKPSEFRSVFKTTTRSIDQHFLVLAKANSLPCARLGLAVSKRDIKNAVNRNYIKRLVRESFRVQQQTLSGLDIIVVTQKRINMLERQKLAGSLQQHWEKIGKCKSS